VSSTKLGPVSKRLHGGVRCKILRRGRLAWLGLAIIFSGFSALAQSSRLQPAGGLPDAPAVQSLVSGQQADQRAPGGVSGTVVDPTGAAIAGARVKMSRDDQSQAQEVLTGEDGQFEFANIVPGSFHLTITSEGFAAQATSGIVHSGEAYVVPQIALAIATEVTEVRVGLAPAEVAEVQLKDQEKQRVLGVIPNFYVSYIPNALPLTSKQKFELAWRTTIDPVNFVVVGAVAGVQQAQNNFAGYGQGAQGYGKRYGAAYADLLTGTYIGSAILPSILKQDPRYFYKGTGSTKSRILYAIANSVICKGDNGHWQPNYSGIAGSLAAGGISNLYYPAADRNGAALTFEGTLIGIGETAAANVLQEFLIRKLTSNVPKPAPASPKSAVNN